MPGVPWSAAAARSGSRHGIACFIKPALCPRRSSCGGQMAPSSRRRAPVTLSLRQLTLPEFLASYGTEEQCLDAPLQWRWPDGFVCPACGHDQCHRLARRDLHQCNRCRRQTSVTARTLLASTKLPLTAWFYALYAVGKGGQASTSIELSRALQISYYAARRLRLNVLQLLNDAERPLALNGVATGFGGGIAATGQHAGKDCPGRSKSRPTAQPDSPPVRNGRNPSH